jgi:hypothetical protein
MKLFPIDISTYIVESDQGSDLKSITEKYQSMHLACICHLLFSLKQYAFSSHIGNPIRFRTLNDFIALTEVYEMEFASMISPEKAILTKITLNGFSHNIIAEASMPTCSNLTPLFEKITFFVLMLREKYKRFYGFNGLKSSSSFKKWQNKNLKLFCKLLF